MAKRKDLTLKKRKHLINHGYVKGVTRGAVDPRPGGDDRDAIIHYDEIKKKIDKDITSVPVWIVKHAGMRAERAKAKLKKAKDAKDEATIKAHIAKDEAEEKARQKKNAEEAKKKPKPTKKKKKPPSDPHRKGRGLSLKRK